ncbi:MAG: TatD family hydrolase [Clostridiales bacterium]|nr:TatD family hydrolase [Clostridiales bacterium]
MFFDTHAHYDDKAFDGDRDALLASMPGEGVKLVIDPGCDLSSSRAAIALAEKYGHVYAAVGIHPEELRDFAPEKLDEIRALALHPKCVAIGEIGLDYYWDDTHKEEQKELFKRQIELALELGKPVIVHDREAHGDSLEIVSEYRKLRGVFHCFSGSAEMARELLRRGWYLGFDGPVTYKNARKAVEVLEICPMDRLLIETDSPYLSPVPVRGKRNDSRNLRYVAQKIGEIKGITAEEVAAASAGNGRALFGI